MDVVSRRFFFLDHPGDQKAETCVLGEKIMDSRDISVFSIFCF